MNYSFIFMCKKKRFQQAQFNDIMGLYIAVKTLWVKNKIGLCGVVDCKYYLFFSVRCIAIFGTTWLKISYIHSGPN